MSLFQSQHPWRLNKDQNIGNEEVNESIKKELS